MIFSDFISQIVLVIIGAIVGGGVTFVVEKKLQETKVLAWSIVTQTNILYENLEGVNSSIKISVDGEEVSSLSLVRIRIENKGNKVIEDVKHLNFFFGESTEIYKYLVSNQGRYGDTITITPVTKKPVKSVEISLPYINIRQSFEVEFLVDRYITDAVKAELVMPGVTIKKDRGDDSWDLNFVLLSSSLITIICLLVLIIVF